MIAKNVKRNLPKIMIWDVLLWLFSFVQNFQLFTKRKICCTITHETNLNVHTVKNYTTKVEIWTFTFQQFMKTEVSDHLLVQNGPNLTYIWIWRLLKVFTHLYLLNPVVTKCGNLQKKAIQCDQCTQSYTSKEGFKCHKLTVQLFRKKEHQILHWHELCKLILKNPKKISSLNVDAIIRGDLCRYTDQLSVLLRQNPHNVAEWLNRVKLFKKKRNLVK